MRRTVDNPVPAAATGAVTPANAEGKSRRDLLTFFTSRRTQTKSTPDISTAPTTHEDTVLGTLDGVIDLFTRGKNIQVGRGPLLAGATGLGVATGLVLSGCDDKPLFPSQEKPDTRETDFVEGGYPYIPPFSNGDLARVLYPQSEQDHEANKLRWDTYRSAISRWKEEDILPTSPDAQFGFTVKVTYGTITPDGQQPYQKTKEQAELEAEQLVRIAEKELEGLGIPYINGNPEALEVPKVGPSGSYDNSLHTNNGTHPNPDEAYFRVIAYQ